MIDPSTLHTRMLHAASVLAEQSRDVPEMTLGQLTWQRADNWTKLAKAPRQWEPGDDEEDERRREGTSEEDAVDRREDATASRYRDELDALTKRLDADLHRLERIIAICCPPPKKRLGSKDLMSVQIASEGKYCVSCYRDAKHLEDVAEGRYRHRCRFCGDWMGEHGEDPPRPLLVLKHSGRTLTAAAVAQAMR